MSKSLYSNFFNPENIKTLSYIVIDKFIFNLNLEISLQRFGEMGYIVFIIQKCYFCYVYRKCCYLRSSETIEATEETAFLGLLLLITFLVTYFVNY